MGYPLPRNSLGRHVVCGALAPVLIWKGLMTHDPLYRGSEPSPATKRIERLRREPSRPLGFWNLDAVSEPRKNPSDEAFSRMWPSPTQLSGLSEIVQF